MWFLYFSQLVFGQLSPVNDPKINSLHLNRTQVSKINNKKIDFYLNHKKIDKYSKMYYKCEFSPSDDELTFGFLDSILTDNKETRPFYFFIFNQILNDADGALGEGMAFISLEYVAKFPCEFLYYSHHDTLVNTSTWIEQLMLTQYDEEFITKL